MRHVRHYTRHTCGKWRVFDGRRRCCTFAKNHEGSCEWEKLMHRYRVRITEEREFIDDVTASSSAEAGTMLGDRIRAGTATPLVAGLTTVDIIRYRDKGEE